MTLKRPELSSTKLLSCLISLLAVTGCGPAPLQESVAQLVPPDKYKIANNEVWYEGRKVGSLSKDETPKKMATLPGGIDGYEVTHLENGDLFFSGGYIVGEDNVASRKTFFWEKKANKIVPGPDMSCPRVEHVVTPLSGNRLLITGGRSCEPSHTFAVAVDIVNLATKSIESGGTLQVDRIEHGVLEMNPECVLVVGGTTFSSPTTNGMDTNSLEIYNPASHQSLRSSILHARHYPELFKIDSHNALVVGGSSADSDKQSKELPVEKVQLFEHL